MAISAPSEALLEVDEALRRLEQQDARKAALVELHYFGGLSYEEIAHETGVSEATVHRELRLAKAWLRQAMQG
jgi:RNA polymerase sigma factor (sigma-70 family)